MARQTLPTIPPLSAGASIGERFEIVSVLGEGGAGVVYDAIRRPEGDHVALKVLHGHLLSDRQIRGRFEREAKILRRLDGPHVCPVLESGEMDDPRQVPGMPGRRLLYMALPKIDGSALDVALRNGGPPSIERALEIMLEVCDALTHAHARGVVHRDLKPANVLLRGGTQVVVVDFGLAKIIAGDQMATVLTAHNMVCGTPEYMAPEQARGDESDERCDVYAAGVMLYELLTGEVPFQAPTPLGVLTAHLTSPVVPARTRAPSRGISEALDAVVVHALAKDPAHRYASAAALASALRQARDFPADVDRVKPETIRVELDPPDVHGPTIPSGIPAYTPSHPPAPAPKSLTPKPPSSAPSRSPLSRDSSVDPIGPRAWAVLWILAALLGISVGVWLSLHTP